jgi:hypothetical protein
MNPGVISPDMILHKAFIELDFSERSKTYLSLDDLMEISWLFIESA